MQKDLDILIFGKKMNGRMKFLLFEPGPNGIRSEELGF